MIHHRRFRVFITFFYFLLVCLFIRAFYMQVIKREFYRQKSESQLQRSIHIYPHRGCIYDRHFTPLAIAKVRYAVYGFPGQMTRKAEFVAKAAPILEMSEDVLRAKVYSSSPFVWIKRKIDAPCYKKLRALQGQLRMQGIEFLKEEERVYPNGRLAAHAMGFVGIDNQGLGGLEYYFDQFLKGSPGKIVLQGDPRGFRVISGYSKTLNHAYDGGYIKTTLDEYVQYVTQKHLREGVEENNANGGIAIVMDPQTGDVLALASVPDFDPNHWVESDVHSRTNKAIVDVYEPGSVFKIVTLSGVLEEKLARPGDVMYVPATIKVGGRLIREAHEREPGESDRRTVTEILEKSLNVGTTMLAQRLGEKRLYSYIKKFGFGDKTGIELPGESRGLLRDVKRWSGSDIGMISFGQGVAVTPVQMVAAVGAIANRGLWMKPRIVDYIRYHQNMSIKGIPKVSRRAVSESTAKEVTDMMIRTVDTGTGVSAQLPGFYVAGKTGTAQKPGANGHGYVTGEYVASFIGFFPAHHPEFVILVVVDTPRKSIYGAAVAAPIFRKIAADLVSYRNLPVERPCHGRRGSI